MVRKGGGEGQGRGGGMKKDERGEVEAGAPGRRRDRGEGGAREPPETGRGAAGTDEGRVGLGRKGGEPRS